LKGLFGRLGDLGTIPAKYDIAISTACPSLNSILVDTKDNAIAAVNFLKKNSLGIATFIYLEEQKDKFERIINEKFEAPEQSQRLFDLVQPQKDIFKAAFYFALKDTLVVKDLDIANVVAFPKNGPKRRVVTLDGNVIDQSGSMSGGGQQQSGGMKASSSSGLSEEELGKVEQNFRKEHEKLKEIRSKLEQLEDKIESNQNSISDIKVNIPKWEMDIKSMEKNARRPTKTFARIGTTMFNNRRRRSTN